MIAFPELLAPAAKQAGIKVPENPRKFWEEAKHDELIAFSHFSIFCSLQLGRPMPYPECVHKNAEIIASISDDRILYVTLQDVLAMGYV